MARASLSMTDIKFVKLYKSTWKPQVDVGNIPERMWYTTCKCHPDITEFIVTERDCEDTEYFSEYVDNVYNLPQEYKEILPEGCDRFKWMIDKLQNMYEKSICGYPCKEDAAVIHDIFWNKISEEERTKIREYLEAKPSRNVKIKLDGKPYIHRFNWIGGWRTFSYDMCALFQKSFEKNDKKK